MPDANCENAAEAPPARGEPVPLIIDTDLSTDCDDVAALSIAHALEQRGEATLLGVVHNADIAAGAGGRR